MILRMGSRVAFIASGLLGIALSADAADPSDFFESRIRPVLVNNCFSCHASSQLGGLRLDSRNAILKGGKSGPALVPGQPEESRLIRAINHPDPKLRMPMGGRLKDDEIADLEAWVKMGAPWPEAATGTRREVNAPIDANRRKFWSFQPLREPVPPAVINEAWPRNQIDRFILSKLEASHLKPAKQADKRTLLRRA